MRGGSCGLLLLATFLNVFDQVSKLLKVYYVLLTVDKARLWRRFFLLLAKKHCQNQTGNVAGQDVEGKQHASGNKRHTSKVQEIRVEVTVHLVHSVKFRSHAHDGDRLNPPDGFFQTLRQDLVLTLRVSRL